MEVATDKLFLECSTYFPNALAKFVRAEADDDESHYRAAAGLFERQFGRSSLLKFTPEIFVFSRIKVEELSQFHDIHLMPLYPLCDISPQEIEQQAPGWAEQIKKAPDLAEDERKNLLSFLGGAVSHRI
jgi:hypothetical protein